MGCELGARFESASEVVGQRENFHVQDVIILRVSLRRDFLKQCAALAAASQAGLAQPKPKRLDEYDAANTKIAHRVSSKIGDDDLLFLKQIGRRWARVEFGEAPAPFESIRAIQERFKRYGIGIYSGVHYSYRSTNVQLGRPGRDKDIETYCGFLRDLGRLGVPVASYDFHPGNTYTDRKSVV